jgi:peptidoglycan/LPS O-acetylase OafA/YrhL
MPNPAASRFRALEGWRGICALLVAAHHVEAHGWLYWQPLIRNAWLFVDFFFVLSGFVIAHAYGARLAKPHDIRVFVVRRLGRLWPLHAAVLIALVALELAHLIIGQAHALTADRSAFGAGRAPFALVTNLFLLQAFGLHDVETWNGPAWSISVEFYTYLVFAAVCFAVPRPRLRLGLYAALSVLGVLVLARFSAYGMRETFHWPFFRCLYGFFLGALAYAVWRGGIARWLSGTVAEVAALAAVAAFLTYIPGNRTLEYLATPLFTVAVFVFAADAGVISRALVTRPAAALGRWSYSIYMVHTLALAALFSAVEAVRPGLLLRAPDGGAMFAPGSATADDLALLLVLAAVVAFSALTWHWIERPGQRLFGRLLSAKPVEIAAETA